MTYQQAGRIAILKRLVGWVIFIPALISTLVSVLKFMYAHSEKQEGINAVMLDFAHVMIDMMRVNTPFLNVFWYNSPTPDFQSGLNLVFWLIFILIFIGLALQDSGARMSRQARYLREGVEDHRQRAVKGYHASNLSRVLWYRTIRSFYKFSRSIFCR